MRLLLLAFSLGLHTTTYAQEKEAYVDQPFQIIYAEHVVNKAGQLIKELDLISLDEVLTVRSDGFLSMMHRFGLPFEIAGDTALNVSNLNSLLDKRKKKTQTYYCRPYIEQLFYSDWAIAARSWRCVLSEPTHRNYDLEIIYPPNNYPNLVAYEGDLCLTWQDTGSKSYEVELMPASEKSIKKYTTTTNSLKIEQTEITELLSKEKKKYEGVFLMVIKDLESNKKSSLFGFKPFYANEFEFPYSCVQQKATHALVTGLYLEMSPRNHLTEAEKYFKLAVELSDKEFYKKMLENFKKRVETRVLPNSK